jgi:hypothetical protein
VLFQGAYQSAIWQAVYGNQALTRRFTDWLLSDAKTRKHLTELEEELQGS